MKLASIIEQLRQRGWTVVLRHEGVLRLPPGVAERHPRLPTPLTEFLGRVAVCEDASQSAWFLCEADYAGTRESAFRWDEWERMSLEAAGTDAGFAAAVRAFWDTHLPFLLSVRDGYAYYAVCTGAEGFGRVVAGREPEFEEVAQVAESFEEFVSSLAHGAVSA